MSIAKFNSVQKLITVYTERLLVISNSCIQSSLSLQPRLRPDPMWYIFLSLCSLVFVYMMYTNYSTTITLCRPVSTLLYWMFFRKKNYVIIPYLSNCVATNRLYHRAWLTFKWKYWNNYCIFWNGEKIY